MSSHLGGPRTLPVACFERTRCRAVRGQERRRKIAVLDAHEVFAALPEPRAPFVRPIQLLMHETGDLAAFAVIGRHGFHWRGVGHRQITEPAEPPEPGGHGPAVKFDGGFHADYIGMIKLEMLGNF